MQEHMARRFPAQVGSWKVLPNEYSIDGLLNILSETVGGIMGKHPNSGILLSGGVDSSILATLASKFARLPHFVVGSSVNHPDVQAAVQVAKLFNLDIYACIPSNAYIEEVRGAHKFECLGDDCVFIALEFASHFVTDILAGDGIDEQMGGYWWHSNRNDEFPKIELAFQHFWERLEPNHLTPMFASASELGISIQWVYLYPDVVDYISRIPLDDRVSGGVGKYIWKQVAERIGVPASIINRPKMGFIDAFSK